MPLRSYGVLKATILDRRLATNRTDHYQLFCGVGTTRWRVAINAHSDVPPSDVMYAAFRTTRGSRNLKDGWRVLRPGEGLDYIRGGLCRPEQFKPLPLSKPGANNDLNELFDLHLTRGAKVYAFGEPFAPAPSAASTTCTRTRATSGSTGATTASGRTAACWFRRAATWTAVLLRFQSQSWRTDDATGHARCRTRACRSRRSPPSSTRSCRAEPGHDRHAEARRVAARVATWYLWEDGRVLVNMDDSRARLDNLRRDPRVSLTVLDGEDWYHHVSLRGRVVSIEPDEDLSASTGCHALHGQPYPGRDSPRHSARIEVDSWHAWKPHS